MALENSPTAEQRASLLLNLEVPEKELDELFEQNRVDALGNLVAVCEQPVQIRLIDGIKRRSGFPILHAENKETGSSTFRAVVPENHLTLLLVTTLDTRGDPLPLSPNRLLIHGAQLPRCERKKMFGATFANHSKQTTFRDQSWKELNEEIPMGEEQIVGTSFQFRAIDNKIGKRGLMLLVFEGEGIERVEEPIIRGHANMTFQDIQRIAQQDVQFDERQPQKRTLINLAPRKAIAAFELEFEKPPEIEQMV